MPYCFGPYCGHGSKNCSKTVSSCRFFRFPQDAKLRKKWVKACRRVDREPGQYDVLCSCHFLDNKKENGPSIFAHNKDKEMHFPYLPLRKSSKRVKETNEQVVSYHHLCVVASDEGAGNGSDDVLMEEDLLQRASTSAVSRDKDTRSKVAKSLQAKINLLKRENSCLRDKLKLAQNKMSILSIKKNDDLIFHYTGLPTFAEFRVLSTTISGCELVDSPGETVDELPHEDQLLCTLMKLRLNLTFMDLGFRFKMSEKAIQDICITYIHAIHKALFKDLMNIIPNEENDLTPVPLYFKYFKNCRIVIDSMEVEVGIPNGAEEQKCFSPYTFRSIIKVLIGIAPNGRITYISDKYPGSSSDNFIAESCGFVYRLTPGDRVLAGKGFQIKDFLSQHDVSLVTPTLSDPQLKEGVIFACRVAKARMHIENIIKNIKAFRILNLIPSEFHAHASVIVQVCGVLVNLQSSMYKK